jgi:FMN phosphatase YigB (HAD superfamily)
MIEEVPMRKVSLLITDLDNTLWDWLTPWARSMDALVRGLHLASGVPEARLLSEIREVHQRRGTVEYSVLVSEIPSLVAMSDGKDLSAAYDDAIHAQNSARKHGTTLYPHVRSTLETVRGRRVPIIAYSEGLEFWTKKRIKDLGLDGLISRLYTSPDHDFPDGMSPQTLRTLPPEAYLLHDTEQRTVARGISKPSPEILSEIVGEYGVPVEEVVYVGDSLRKDVFMAQALGVIDVFAEYGLANQRADSDLLISLSHWTASEVEASRSVPQEKVIPTYTLRKGFDELLSLFRFEAGSNEAPQTTGRSVDGGLGPISPSAATL